MSPTGVVRYRFFHGVRDLGFALLLVGISFTDANAAGQICTSVDTIQFGNVLVGSITTANATVTNCGDATWTFTDVYVDPVSGPAFHVNTGCTTGLTLKPGATCSVSVVFAPTTTGQTSGGLWLDNTTITPDQLIAFYGRGINEENGTASLAFVPASANFGTHAVGTTAAPLSIALLNQGPGALTLSAAVLNGPEAYDFLGYDGTCVIGITIKAGNSCSFILEFRPQAAGLRLANLVIDAPQLASLAIMPISGIGQSGNSQANYEGLWWAAPAGSESGWGINFAHQGQTIFATWFSYDRSGKGWWLSMTAPEVAPGTYSGALQVTTGPAFNAVPFNPAKLTTTEVGKGTLTFSDANDGTFAYTVSGVMQTKSITRQVFGSLPVCATATTSLAAATNYTDLWWASPAGSEPGWGIFLTQEGTTIFATWFTYAVDGTPMWMSSTAPQTARGIFSGTLYQTTGPAFDAVPFNPADVVLTSVGTATFTFSDGNDASFAYTVNGVSQTKAITREVFQGPGTICQ